MFGKKDKTPTRCVVRYDQLQIGDLVTLKYRQSLPEVISGETLTVEEVSSYDYEGELSPDYTLSHSSGLKITSSYDGELETVTFSYKLSHNDIVKIFDGDELGRIFDEDESNPRLEVIGDGVPEDLKPWLASGYTRTTNSGRAYFYKEDKRQQGLSEFEDPGCMPFTYIDLIGTDDSRSISIEVWEDGETDIFVGITVNASSIESFLTNAE